MKLVFTILALAFATLLVGCADQSLITDEEYRERKGPAPHAPDYSNRGY
jgi:hypothetical protein